MCLVGGAGWGLEQAYTAPLRGRRYPSTDPATSRKSRIEGSWPLGVRGVKIPPQRVTGTGGIVGGIWRYGPSPPPPLRDPPPHLWL